ncbi:hypothetical protein Tco_1563452 [Tanacetum coccineum]
MAALPICDELQRSVNSSDWEPQYVPDKMADFMKQVQGKDILNFMKLQILRRELELRAREKGIFIEKLKGNMDY